MKNDDESNSNNYNVYLILGSFVVFLFLLAPIILIYVADIYLLILIIMILGIFLLIGFLIMILRSFNNWDKIDGAENLKNSANDLKVKTQNDFSKNANNVKSRENSNFNVRFSKSIGSHFEGIDNEEDEYFYSLNMSEEDFYRYRKL